MDEFLTAFVQRECGIVTYYEPWNEPNQRNFWRGSDAQLLTIVQHVYSIVKNPANCGCRGRACSPGGGSNPNQVLTLAPNTICCAAVRRWLTDWLTLAGKSGPYADIVSFHGYELEPEQVDNNVAWLRRLADAHGLGKAQIWDTEASWGEHKSETAEQDASWLMRSYTTHAASGVSRFYWYAFGSCLWGSLYGPSCGAAPDNEQGLRKAGIAYQTIAKWLSGATMKGCTHDGDHTWSCPITRPNGYRAVILWNPASARQVSSPATDLVQYRDWQDATHSMGKTVPASSMPILLENKAAS
jgi:hypothetical protein